MPKRKKGKNTAGINQAQLKSEVKAASFGAPATVKHLGNPNKAITAQGDVVRRVGAFYEPTLGKYIGVVPYDIHFIFQNPDSMVRGESIVERVPRPIKRSAIYLCTCGAIAGVASGENIPPEYKGKLACQYDLMTGFKGKHQTSQVNRRDFSRHAGQTLTPKQ